MSRYTSVHVLLFAVWGFCNLAKAQPFVTGEVGFSNDSDGFQTNSLSAGIGRYMSDENFYDRIGYKHSSMNFSAPGLSMHGNSDSLFGGKAFSSPIGPINGEFELGKINLPANVRTIGSVQVSGQPTRAVNYEVRDERNIVESFNGLNNRVTYSSRTFAIDYQFTPLINIAGVLGQLNFSDQNKRMLWKAKATYVLSEEKGIRTYFKSTRYSNSVPYTGNYFSPASFQDYQIGFGFRRRLSILRGVLSGYAEAGSQSADSVNSPIHGEQIKLEAFPNRPWHYDVSIGIQTSAGTSGGANYEYRYAKASVVWPF